MRTMLAQCDMSAPRDLSDALARLSQDPELRLFAGGTDLMVLLQAGTLPHGRYLNLWGLDELRGVRVSDDAVALGALTTYTEVLANRVLRTEFPLMCRAAAETGAIAIQNRGTVGGNIANASPAADTPPALLVYDAELELVSTRGSRRVPYESFHTGYKQMDMAPDEIIRSITVPRGRRGWREQYRKVGTRRAQAISKVCFAAAMDVTGGIVRDVRIALGSVAPTVVRCRTAERVLRGRRPNGDSARAAATALRQDIAPIDDIRSTARYRLRVAENLVRDFITESPLNDPAETDLRSGDGPIT